MALAVDGLVDGDLHGALLAAEPHAVRVEAVRQRDLPLPVGGLAATFAVLGTYRIPAHLTMGNQTTG